MINYSIVVRSAQPGLCAEDITETRAYGLAQSSDVMTLRQFSRHIANHGSVYKRSDVQAILIQAVDCLREQLLEGKVVQLGEMGTFSIGLKTRGAETPAEFTADNIVGVHVNWSPGVEFKNLKSDASFRLVPIRKEVADLIRKQKGLDEGGEEEKTEGGSEQE